MRVLLTGASGFIGQHVASKLKAQNITYVALGRNSKLSHSHHITANLLTTSDFAEVMAEADPTHLIHLAWYTEHGKYWHSPLNLDWVMATHRLLEAFCKHGGQYALIAGTCAEYDWNYGFCNEDLTPLNPQTVYGAAKDSSRRLSQLLCHQYDIPLGWTRIFFPYGFGEGEQRLIPSLFRAFRQETDSFGVNSSSFRDLLHVSDLADALLACLFEHVTGSINISSGEPVSIRTIVEKIASIYSQDPSLILDLEPDRKNEPPLLVGNNQKLKDLGWKPMITLDEGLLDYQ